MNKKKKIKRDLFKNFLFNLQELSPNVVYIPKWGLRGTESRGIWHQIGGRVVRPENKNMG